MKTAVIGAGAMGSLFGGLLARSGEEVWLVDIWRDHVEAIRSRGLQFEDQGETSAIPVRATTEIGDVGRADLVLLFVKTYHTEKAVSDALPLVKEDTVFLTLQNGLGNEEAICRQVDRTKVLLGVTGRGATLLGPGHIRNGGTGKTFIGELGGAMSERTVRIAQTFSRAGLEMEVSPRIHDLVWDKLLVNVGINVLGALTGYKNGQLLDQPETRNLMEALVREAAEVARRLGVQLTGDPLERVRAVAELTAQNRCSMGQDIDFKRKTEIDVINGAVVREAERLGIPAPVNRTVAQLIRAIEKGFGR
jgi:2-dehydropantoate 2-reductase